MAFGACCSGAPRSASAVARSLKNMSAGFSQNQRNTGGHRPPLQLTVHLPHSTTVADPRYHTQTARTMSTLAMIEPESAVEYGRSMPSLNVERMTRVAAVT